MARVFLAMFGLTRSFHAISSPSDGVYNFTLMLNCIISIIFQFSSIKRNTVTIVGRIALPVCVV